MHSSNRKPHYNVLVLPTCSTINGLRAATLLRNRGTAECKKKKKQNKDLFTLEGEDHIRPTMQKYLRSCIPLNACNGIPLYSQSNPIDPACNWQVTCRYYIWHSTWRSTRCWSTWYSARRMLPEKRNACIRLKQKKQMILLVLKLVKIRLHVAQSLIMKTCKPLPSQLCKFLFP